MRRGELLRLRWDDIDDDKGFVRIKHPKAGKSHSIPLSEKAREILADIPRMGETVFVGRDGGPRRCINRALRSIKDKAELPADFRILHGLRHHFASTMVSSGVDLYTVQRLLGHSSPVMTQRYSHLADSTLRSATETVTAALDEQVKEAEKAEKKEASQTG